VTPYLPSAVYLLCFITSTVCAYLLGASYRRTRAPLLMWSALCFFLLALNNLILVIDLLVVRSVDLQVPRLLLSLAAVSTLLFGFIWTEGDER